MATLRELPRDVAWWVTTLQLQTIRGIRTHPYCNLFTQGVQDPTRGHQRQRSSHYVRKLSTLTSTIATAVTRALQEIVQVPPSVPSASPAIQFVPDPTVGASATINGGSDLADTNPGPSNTDQTVQHTVDSAVQQVTGSLFPCEVVPPQSKNTFLASAVSLTHRVPDKVKKQIWANEYVDFAILLNSNLTQSDEH